MYKEIKKLLETAQRVVIIQAENPDGDSLGSALALEELLGDQGKQVSLYCPVDIPKYLRYAKGWDRVTNDFPKLLDAAIIVDTASKTLLEKALKPQVLAKLEHMPVIVIDHHATAGDLPFKTIDVIDSSVVATGELIFNVATTLEWSINPQAAEHLIISILSDSLGLNSEATTANTVHAVGTLIEKGAKLSDIDTRRREFMRKSPEILEYKGKLLQRIEYFLDGALAFVHIPWEEIEQYSDQYNPSMLAMDEMRLVEGVKIAVALKSYPDGRVTGKIRVNPDAKIADVVAGYFGGGGHAYAAGFRVYEDIDTVKRELLDAADKSLEAYADEN